MSLRATGPNEFSAYALRAALASGVLSAVMTVAGSAAAQQGPPVPGRGAPGPGTVTVPTEQGDVVVTPGSTESMQIYVPPPGYPQPGVDINEGLPESSRPRLNPDTQRDGFDFQRGSDGPNIVQGDKDAEGILESAPSGRGAVGVPRLHTVRRGDTLWDLCGQYYGNPYNWPRVWSFNPQIENPHWIYPGDQLRLREGGGSAPVAGAGGAGETRRGLQQGGGGAGRVPPSTVFLRSQAFIGDPKRDVWGEIVGSREDQMLLSAGNNVYVQVRPGVTPQPGQELTIFHQVPQREQVKGARKPPGEIVKVNGTIRVEQWDPKGRIARGRITESLDVIERGAKVGAATRSLDVVPVKPNSVELSARVLGSVYPHVYLAQNQVVFIDRGAEDGLVPGNRLFVVRKGDAWRQTLRDDKTMSRDRPVMDSPKDVQVERTPLAGDEKYFPDEIVGELRVLRADRFSSLALVTSSSREIVVGDRAVTKKGY